MPSRRRPKPPPAPPLTDIERFAQAVRESEAAERRARDEARERKAEAERRAQEAADHAARLQRARAAHQRAVEMVREAKRTGRGTVEADQAWKHAKAELIELETGQPPAWAKSSAGDAESAPTEDADPPPTQ